MMMRVDNNMILMATTLMVAAMSLMMVDAAGGAVDISQDNLAEVTKGKNSFMKFFAPWCGHCKSMAPAWDQLGDEYEGSSSVLIGSVDCTEAGKEVCETHGVSGYPTIKYFFAGSDKAEDYQGGRDYDSLKAFVEETLEIKCDVKDPKAACSDKEVEYIEKMKGKPSADRVKQISRLENMAGSSMKADLKAWLRQRLHILRTLEQEL